MKNELQIFNSSEFGEIRTVQIDGEPWFVGKDVAMALGYKNTKDALIKHVEREDKRGSQIATPGGEQQMTIINESGVYALIFGSKLESAKRFKRWVTSEVLPTIRKTGGFVQEDSCQPDIQVSVMQPDIFLEAARIMASVPDSQRYVINCLRHIVPDIDEMPTVIVKTDNTVIETPILESAVTQVSVTTNEGYSKPFNHDQFSNYLIENKIKHYWLEAELNCSSGLVGKWTRGTRPSEAYRIKLCQVLNLPVGYFDNSRRVRRIRK